MAVLTFCLIVSRHGLRLSSQATAQLQPSRAIRQSCRNQATPTLKAGDHPSWGDINRITEVSLYPNSMTDTVVLKFTKPPSVTKILSATQSAESKYNLTQWKKRKIKEFGYEGFQQYKQNLFSRGHAIHAIIHQQLLGDDKDIANRHLAEGFWESVSHKLKNFHDVILCEEKLHHRSLGYCGIIDCISHYNKSGAFVIDWKTSEQKHTHLSQTYDQPLQIAAYVGMWNSQNPNTPIDEGMIVKMYDDGCECDVIHISASQMLHYWTLWIERYKLYCQQILSDTPSW